MIKKIVLIAIMGLVYSGIVYAQDVNLTIGIRDSLHSKILNENRKIVVSLPNNYQSSNKTYPVLYWLDGSETRILDAIVLTRKLGTEMIIVTIPNTNRDRDMMPLSAPSYKVDNPGAKKFVSFLGNELIPHVEKNYRSNGERTIIGQSLSGLFIMYAFLENPELFKNYIGNSAGWFADMNPFFDTLTENAFKNKDRYNGRRMFIANSLIDSDDPKKEVHNAVLAFSKKLESQLGDRVSFKYVTYDTYGHVPFPGYYDGLKYVLRVK